MNEKPVAWYNPDKPNAVISAAQYPHLLPKNKVGYLPCYLESKQDCNDALAKAEQEARRYRWLRDVGDATWKPFALREGCSAQKVDAAIDEAMKRDKACSASG